MEEVGKNEQLRRIIAQFALQDRADEVKRFHGPHPVAYNDIPVKRDVPSFAKPQSAPKKTLGAKVSSAASNFGSKLKAAAQWVGKGLSRLFS